MAGTIADSYDALPYESSFNPLAHPDRLAAMAALFGLEAPKVETCRVLELGCGVGGHVIGLAQSLPGAEIVGLDISPRQIELGRATARDLDVTNLTLTAQSLTEVDDAFGRFDYILCHGVYSWVPEAVQARILEIGGRHLTPNGVLFLSYNVFPGWFQRGLVRDAMQFHTRHIAEPLRRVAEGRAFLDFLIRATTPPNTPYALALTQEADALKKVNDTYVFHEHLEDENRPAYVREVVARAAGSGLNYLGPARFSLLEMQVAPDVREAIDGFATDRIEREQYLDFVLNRAFRQSLFCRADASPLPEPTPAAVPALLFTAMARPESPNPDVVSDAPVPFQTMHGDHLTLNLPRLKAALVALFDRWPLSYSFEALRRASLARLGRDDHETDAEADRRDFARLVLDGITCTVIEPHVIEPPVTAAPGPAPRTTPLARRQASAGERVVNLRGAFAALRDLDRLVVPYLDGTRDRPAVVAALTELALRGDLTLRRDGAVVTDPDAVRAILDEQVAASFGRLAFEALFLSG